MRITNRSGLFAVLMVGMAVPFGAAVAQRAALQEIQAPVTTGFGAYTPYAIPPYRAQVGLSEPTVSPNFSNVATPGSGFPWTSYFSNGERALLLRNNMMARPEAFATFAQAYAPETSPVDLPSFVTVDAVLHGLRMTALEALRVSERDHAAPTLLSILDDLSGAFSKALDGEKNRVIADADRRLLAYVQTAQALLEKGTSVDSRVAGMVDQELARIRSAAGSAESAIVPSTTIDYSRFRPSGYDASSQATADYFRARTWLSEVGFPLRDRSGSIESDVARMGILLARAMDNLASSGDFRDRYMGISEMYAFFGGRPEGELTWDVIAGATRGYYGRFVTADASALADEGELEKFVNYVDEQAPAGRSGSRTFRLLGKTSSSVDAMIAAAGGSRLGLAAALGSDRARTSAAATASAGDLSSALSRPGEDWVQDMNWALLYTARPLIGSGERADSYPRFMRSAVWRDRELTGALGAWADYAHLPAVVQMTAAGSAARAVGRGGGSDIGSEGYVEPNPEAWARVASLAGYLRNGFTEGPNGRLAGAAVERKLSDIESAAAGMMQIAARELEGKELSDNQLDLIASMPSRLAAYEAFSDRSLQGANGSAMLAGGAGSGANGHPLAIYVIVPRNDGDGGLMLTRGAVYSYFEPSTADAGWTDRLTREGSSVQAPAWMTSFVSTEKGGFAQDARKFRAVEGTIPAAVAYVPSAAEQKRALAAVQLDMESNVVRRSGGELWVTVKAQQLDGVDIVLSVVNTSGRVVYTSSPARIEGGERYDVVRVENLPAGQYFLRVTDPLNQQLASGRFMVVR